MHCIRTSPRTVGVLTLRKLYATELICICVCHSVEAINLSAGGTLCDPHVIPMWPPCHLSRAAWCLQHILTNLYWHAFTCETDDILSLNSGEHAVQNLQVCRCVADKSTGLQASTLHLTPRIFGRQAYRPMWLACSICKPHHPRHASSTLQAYPPSRQHSMFQPRS